MALLYGVLNGTGHCTTRGTERSGLRAFCQTWDLGIEVEASIGQDGKVFFNVYKTGGSHNTRRQCLVYSTALDEEEEEE
jgi:hypothetical protein